MSESSVSGEASRPAPRVPVRAEVRVRFEDREIETTSANISLTGMFLRAPRPRPAGTRLHFELKLSDDSVVTGVAEVVWKRLEDESEERPAGMGILFFRLDRDGRDVISGVVERHLRRAGPSA